MTDYKNDLYDPELDIIPGDMLFYEFMEPLGLTKYRLAKETGLSPTHIGQIISGKRSITHIAGLKLDRRFAMSDGFFAHVQYKCDLRKALRELAHSA